MIVHFMKWIPDPDEEGMFCEAKAAPTSVMDTVPRVGEEIWPQPHGSYPVCIVTDVAYWVGEHSCSAAVYCEERDKKV